MTSFAGGAAILAASGGDAAPAPQPVPVAPPRIVTEPNQAPRVIAPPPLLVKKGAEILVSKDGKALILDGDIARGTAQRFASVLAGAPAARRLVLNSTGGLIGEAGEIADSVRKRGLDTYVETICASACTIILLAGHDRAATPKARIGFHDFTFPTTSPTTVALLRAWGRLYYDKAGVSPTFTDKALATPPSRIWYPTDDELLAAHVLTRVSLGGETSLIATLVTSKAELEKQFEKLTFWSLLKQKHPDLAASFVDTAWAAREQGKTDAEVTAAGRAKLIAAFPRLMRDASDETFVKYFELLIDQVRAARALSFEACDGVFSGTLDIVHTLPPELASREQALLLESLSAPAQQRAKPKTIDQVMPVLAPLFGKLTPEQRAAIGGSGRGGYSKADRCNGMLALLEGIRGQPRPQQIEIVRALFFAE